MTTFETTRHLEINVNYQGVNLTEFSLVADNQTNNDQIVDTFIRSNHFTNDSLLGCVKKASDKEYLRPAFDINKINITDFKKYSKQGTINYLSEYLNKPDWGADRNEFVELFDKYLKVHNQLGNNIFYIISKDWFDKGDSRVLEPESWVYGYYFLIVSVDRNLNILTLTEWTYD